MGDGAPPRRRRGAALAALLALPGVAALLGAAVAMGGGAADPAAGQRVFAQAGCGACHTLTAAGSKDTIGPSLDERKPTVYRVSPQELFGSTCGGCHRLAAPGTSGTIGPNLDDERPSCDKVVERVSQGKGRVPSFAGQLSVEEIRRVADYVAVSAGRDAGECSYPTAVDCPGARTST
jgi:mono/diheme cytochrome c family protein